MKILVVDDVTCRDLLSEILRRSSYEVLTAANGREALEILADGECQVVISDWVMPEVNGPTLCRAIRCAERRHYVFIILLTSRDAPEDVQEGLLAGADEFMIKPFTPAEVMARVRTAERILGLAFANLQMPAALGVFRCLIARWRGGAGVAGQSWPEWWSVLAQRRAG